jgi:site-specific recombinase XerD
LRSSDTFSENPLSRLPIKHITRAHVPAHIRTIGKERGAVTANHARTTLSGMFTWAMKQGLVENNPVVATHRAVDEVARDRVLSGAELVAIWNACRDDDYGHIVRLLPDQVRRTATLPHSLCRPPSLIHARPLSGRIACRRPLASG